MRKFCSVIKLVVVALLTICILGTVELLVRISYAKALPATLSNDVVRIVGKVTPRFLFIGEEWYMKVHAKKPLSLGVNGTYVITVPIGTSEINYYSDDETTTGNFTESGRIFREVPSHVVLIDDLEKRGSAN